MNVSFHRIPCRGQNTLASHGAFSRQTHRFHQLQPLLDSACVFAVSIMVQNPLSPNSPEGGIVTACQDRGVFPRNMRLIETAVQRPRLELPALEFPLVHQKVKRVLVMIAVSPDGMKASDEFCLRQRRIVHKQMSMPS